MYLNKSVRTTLMALLAFGFLGCDSPERVAGPEIVEIGGPLMSSGTVALQVVEDGVVLDNGVSTVIGSEGGQLVLGNVTLTVPAGAVEQPTLFEMTKGGGYMRVTLSATYLTFNDVGSAGFPTPLTLTFDYREAAASLGNPSSFAVVWVRPDGVLELQPTVLDEASELVHGSVSHFSDYAMASD